MDLSSFINGALLRNPGVIHITPQPLLGPAVQNSESWATVGCLAGFINAPNAAGVWEAVGTWAWWMAAALDFSAGVALGCLDLGMEAEPHEPAVWLLQSCSLLGCRVAQQIRISACFWVGEALASWLLP